MNFSDEEKSDCHALEIEEPIEESNLQVILHILKEGWPFWLNRLIEVGVDFSAMSILSQLNTETESAASLITSMCIIIKSIDATFLYYTAQAVRERRGEHPAVGVVLRKAWLFALPLSMFSISIALSSESILKGLGQPAESARIVKNFLYPYALGLPFTLLTVANQQMLLGIEKPKIVLGMTMLNAPLILALGYPMIYGKMGFPLLEESGLGYAYTIAAITHFTSYLFLFKKHFDFTHYNIFSRDCIFNRDGIYTLLVRKGFGIGIYSCIELGSSWATTLLIGLNGKPALSAVQPAAQYASVIANLTFALGHNIGIIVKDKITHCEWLNAKKTARIGLMMGFSLPILILFIALSTQNLMLRPFLSENTSDSVISLANQLLLINLIGQVIDSLRNTGSGILRGFSNTASPANINTSVILLISLPASFITQYALGWGPRGVLSSRVLGIILGGGLILRKCLQEMLLLSSNDRSPLLSSDNKQHSDEEQPVNKGCWVRCLARISIWNRAKVQDQKKTSALSCSIQ